MKVTLQHRVFEFKTPSGTSRGVLSEKQAWFLTIGAQEKTGMGECSIIPGLSPDFENFEQYTQLLNTLVEALQAINLLPFASFSEFDLLRKIKTDTNLYQRFGRFPSLIFGLETALLNWSKGTPELFFNTPFTQGKCPLPINGLVWMGPPEYMAQQMFEKVNHGYNCVKLKIGAIDFDSELELLETFRKKYPTHEMMLRVDANGAFTANDVRDKLRRLSACGIHSIEQPIAPGQYDLMSELCAENILPIALDEELIGITDRAEKKRLLDTIKPQYIILKPSLHGGILAAQEWIRLAEERNIGWWMTSALESNLGLACIAQFTSTYTIQKHQGLGTGSLYVENLPTKLTVNQGQIHYSNS